MRPSALLTPPLTTSLPPADHHGGGRVRTARWPAPRRGNDEMQGRYRPSLPDARANGAVVESSLRRAHRLPPLGRHGPRSAGAAAPPPPPPCLPHPSPLPPPPPPGGAPAPRAGPYARLGQNQVRGYRLCVKHTNEKGGVLGRRLELLVEDDRSDPATGARIYEQLITRDKVDA